MKGRGLRSPVRPGVLVGRSGFFTPSFPKEEEAPMEREYVGIDLHRRRSVIVRKNETGEHLSSVRIANEPAELAAAVSAATRTPR